MQNTDWMHALAAHYRAACNTRSAPLLLLCDIDDTLLDTRFMIRAVLQTGDAERGTGYFSDLELDEIWMPESRIAELLAPRSVPPAEQAAVLRSYAQHAWSAPALRHWQTALPGAMQLLAWFQQQPRTSVALVTGRSAWMRADTLHCINRLGAPHGVSISEAQLFTCSANWEDEHLPSMKVAGLQHYAAQGFSALAFIDNEPANLAAVAADPASSECLLLHADTIFETDRALLPARAVSGSSFHLAALQPG